MKFPNIGGKKADNAENSSSAPAAANKKATKSEMGEYLSETVGSAMTDVIVKNENFIVRENGKTYYIGMLLDVTKIGGINKKAVNNKDIGGVIEAIKSNHIDAYITDEFNNNNELLFIPSAATFDRLMDYGVFRRVDGYEFIKLDKKLNVVERTGVFGTYDEFRDIGNGSKKITEFVKPKDVIVQGSPEDPTANHNPLATFANKIKDVTSDVVEKAAPVVTKAVNTVTEKISETSGIKDMVPSKAEKPKEEPKQEASVVENTQPVQQAPVQQQTVQPAAPVSTIPAEDEQEVTYTETSIMSTIERVFHADNLDLPVSTEPFDQLFTLNNHLIKFDIDSRDTYVNERLNVMAADANRDLLKLRADNLKKLREKYIMVMSVRILDIQREFDINDKSTPYGQRKWNIDETREKRVESVATEIEAKRKEIEDEYNKSLEEYCEAEAKKARSEYNNKYQRTCNDRMNQVESLVKAEIDNDYNRAISDLYTSRRSEALTLLDMNVTMTLKELAEEYKAMFEEENALYIERAEQMREYTKELHAEDAKRLAIEEERNRISNEVNDARAEAAAKIELIRKEFETAQAALEARSEATIAQAENQNTLIKEQMDARTSALEQDKERLQKQLDEAIKRADEAQENVRADYEHRLTQAQDDRDSWKQTLESYKEQHKHNNRLATILVIAITIAAIAGGFVAGGVYWNRIVAGELTNNSSDVEINVIDPNTVNTTTELESAVTDALTDNETENTETSNEKTAETSVPEESEITSSVTTAVTTVPEDDEDTSSVTTPVTTRSAGTFTTTGRN